MNFEQWQRSKKIKAEAEAAAKRTVERVLNAVKEPAMSEFKDFRACPVCKEQSEQCLTCASYVVDGERIYYEKLKDFGATQDHELRFIQRIQKHRTTAFFHKGRLYIPSRQGRSVPLAIGLQWEAWQEQQAKIVELEHKLSVALGDIEVANKNLRDRLVAYGLVRHEADDLQKRVDAALKIHDQFDDEDDVRLMMYAVEQVLKGEG
ncbi:hypothetical protein [Acinetobacter sp. ABJ_C5_2]|uniref:hypothetical protein n=1 Tax=Acinetobacter sp. ABJ_C5_2 TaxID=3376992 RepID=UPI0037C63FF2